MQNWIGFDAFKPALTRPSSTQPIVNASKSNLSLSYDKSNPNFNPSMIPHALIFVQSGASIQCCEYSHNFPQPDLHIKNLVESTCQSTYITANPCMCDVIHPLGETNHRFMLETL
jgi:hypothetical protein